MTGCHGDEKRLGPLPGKLDFDFRIACDRTLSDSLTFIVYVQYIL